MKACACAPLLTPSALRKTADVLRVEPSSVGGASPMEPCKTKDLQEPVSIQLADDTTHAEKSSRHLYPLKVREFGSYETAIFLGSKSQLGPSNMVQRQGERDATELHVGLNIFVRRVDSHEYIGTRTTMQNSPKQKLPKCLPTNA